MSNSEFFGVLGSTVMASAETEERLREVVEHNSDIPFSDGLVKDGKLYRTKVKLWVYNGK